MNNTRPQIKLFETLSTRSRSKLAGIEQLKTLEKGQVLFMEGSEGSHVYVLESGAIKLFRLTDDGHETVLHVVRPGELFAEVLLFGRPTYPVTAEALSDSRVRQLSVGGLRDLLNEENFRLDFFSAIMDKLRLLADRIHILTSCDPTERLLRFLENRYGRTHSYEVDLSKKNIAAAIGLTPETLSRLIAEHSSSGSMSWKGSTLAVGEELWKKAGL